MEANSLQDEPFFFSIKEKCRPLNSTHTARTDLIHAPPNLYVLSSNLTYELLKVASTCLVLPHTLYLLLQPKYFSATAHSRRPTFWRPRCALSLSHLSCVEKGSAWKSLVFILPEDCNADYIAIAAMMLSAPAEDNVLDSRKSRDS